MASSQTVLFTIMPRSLTLNAEQLPLSVFVSPRLIGESKLGAFPDWLNWTQLLREHGLSFHLRTNKQPIEVRINPKPLRPDLWSALFNESTFVRSHTFDDNVDKSVISYSMRETLSSLKELYQEASVALALPDSIEGGTRDHGNRDLLSSMLDGMDVHWDSKFAKTWRARLHDYQFSEGIYLFDAKRLKHRYIANELDTEGLIKKPLNRNTNCAVTIPFTAFHRMPQLPGDVAPEPLPKDTNIDIDFHQALSSLNSYSDLLRALGLVFDLDIPRDLIPMTATAGDTFETISIQAVHPGWDWAIPTQTPELATAYVHVQANEHLGVFLPASLAMHKDNYKTQLIQLLNLDPAHTRLTQIEVESATYKNENDTQLIGLLNLDPTRFGLAQVDVDGAMHKNIILAEIMRPKPYANQIERGNLDESVKMDEAQYPNIYDPDATLPSLRSSGWQLYADERATKLLDAFQQNKTFNDALKNNSQPRPFYAEDLVRGYRLDVWDSHTRSWHSLHQRNGKYAIGTNNAPFVTEIEEGFVQLSAGKAVKAANDAAGANDEFYLHETIARWAGWSLSAEMPGKALSRYSDPNKAIPQEGDSDYATDEAATSFQVKVRYRVVPSSLPKLRFGTRYRFRIRAVDLCGNSLSLGALTDAISLNMALPQNAEGAPYLRFEPVTSPTVILREPKAITDPGAQLNHLIIRTYNADPSLDETAADTTAAERHLVPPRTSVELAERHGMFDDANGKLMTDGNTYALIRNRDAGEFNQITVNVKGQNKTFALEAGERIDVLPYLPDPFARGAALRNLPGTASGSIAHLSSYLGVASDVPYTMLSGPTPRPGSVTMVTFGKSDEDQDWRNLHSIRLILAESPPHTNPPPHWDPIACTLTIFLPKGHIAVVPLSSFMNSKDLTLMGQWKWLCEHIETITFSEPHPEYLQHCQYQFKLSQRKSGQTEPAGVSR